MGEEREIPIERQTLLDLEAAVAYLRDHLDPFGRRRLKELFGAGTVWSEVIRLSDYLQAEEIISSTINPVVNLCYAKLGEEPEAPREVYAVVASLWRNPDRYKFAEVADLMQQGLAYHSDNPRYFAQLAVMYADEASHCSGRWDLIANHAKTALHYAELCRELDPNESKSSLDGLFGSFPAFIDYAEGKAEEQDRQRLGLLRQILDEL